MPHPISIQHIEGLCYTPALLPAMRAALELLENDQSEPITTVFWDNNAVIAQSNGLTVGIITWKYVDWTKTVNIYLGWVDHEYRQRGIYKQLWNALVEKSISLGAKHIVGTTHINNHPMRAVAAKLGRTELSINLSYKLP